MTAILFVTEMIAAFLLASVALSSRENLAVAVALLAGLYFSNGVAHVNPMISVVAHVQGGSQTSITLTRIAAQLTGGLVALWLHKQRSPSA